MNEDPPLSGAHQELTNVLAILMEEWPIDTAYVNPAQAATVITSQLRKAKADCKSKQALLDEVVRFLSLQRTARLHIEEQNRRYRTALKSIASMSAVEGQLGFGSRAVLSDLISLAKAALNEGIS